jgi:signal transduction histidine kinase
MNILSNAIQAIDENGEIFIKTKSEGSNVIIQIRDSGKGMTDEVQKRVFEPFYTTKGMGKGTGLGLSISYSIVEQHNGKIDISSEPSKGTEFIITLPVQQKAAIHDPSNQ